MKIIFDQEDLQRLPITIDAEVLGGRPVFTGTRVPIDALWNNLADGGSLEQFLEWFPTVSKKQAEALLEFGYRAMAAAA